jgi:hypothetical protein
MEAETEAEKEKKKEKVDWRSRVLITEKQVSPMRGMRMKSNPPMRLQVR